MPSQQLQHTLPRLSEKTRFPEWERDIRSRLLAIDPDLYNIVFTVVAPPLASETDKVDQHARRKAQAYGLLSCAIPDSMREAIPTDAAKLDPHALWARVKQLADRPVIASKFELRTKLDQLQQGSQPFTKLYDSFRVLDQDFTAIGTPMLFEERIHALCLKVSPHLLPAVRDVFERMAQIEQTRKPFQKGMTALDVHNFWSVEEQQMAPLYESLVQSFKETDALHRRQRDSNTSDDPIAALLATGQVSCFHCKGSHLKRDCPKLQGGGKGNNKKKKGKDSNKDSNESNSDSKSDSKPSDQSPSSSSDTKKPSSTGMVAVDRDDTQSDSIALYSSGVDSGRSAWLWDGGATHHICNDASLFSNLRRFTSPKTVTGIGNDITTEFFGDVELLLKIGEKERHATLRDVRLLPASPVCLFSTETVEGLYDAVTQSKQGYACIRRKDGEILAEAEQRGRAKYLRCRPADHTERPERYLAALGSATAFATATADADEAFWLGQHRRLGHAGIKQLRLLLKSENVNTPPGGAECISKCEVCARTKFPALPHLRSTTTYSYPLELVVSDLMGPLDVASPSGRSYILTFVDVATRMAWIYPIRAKSDTFASFKQWLELAQGQSRRSLRRLRTDGGGEYLGNAMASFLREKGIEHQVTPPYSPQANGIAERYNRSLMEMVRAFSS